MAVHHRYADAWQGVSTCHLCMHSPTTPHPNPTPPQSAESVQEAFVRLHDKGLVYRGSYMVNWSPGLQTGARHEVSIVCFFGGGALRSWLPGHWGSGRVRCGSAGGVVVVVWRLLNLGRGICIACCSLTSRQRP